MLLAIDIGNTNIGIGVFDGENLRATWRLSTDVHKLEDEYAVTFLSLLSMKGLVFADINHAIISSSVPPLVTTFEELCGLPKVGHRPVGAVADVGLVDRNALGIRERRDVPGRVRHRDQRAKGVEVHPDLAGELRVSV